MSCRRPTTASAWACSSSAAATAPGDAPLPSSRPARLSWISTTRPRSPKRSHTCATEWSTSAWRAGSPDRRSISLSSLADSSSRTVRSRPACNAGLASLKMPMTKSRVAFARRASSRATLACCTATRPATATAVTAAVTPPAIQRLRTRNLRRLTQAEGGRACTARPLSQRRRSSCSASAEPYRSRGSRAKALSTTASRSPCSWRASRFGVVSRTAAIVRSSAERLGERTLPSRMASS